MNNCSHPFYVNAEVSLLLTLANAACLATTKNCCNCCILAVNKILLNFITTQQYSVVKHILRHFKNIRHTYSGQHKTNYYSSRPLILRRRGWKSRPCCVINMNTVNLHRGNANKLKLVVTSHYLLLEGLWNIVLMNALIK